jgi:hypothetical protein
VLQRVRQRLLDDAVGRELDAQRQGTPLAFDPEAHGEPGVVHGRDELLELVKPRLRREPELLARVSQQPDEAAHLHEGVPARLLDGADRLERGFRASLQDFLRGTRLHHHHRDRVRDHIVELAGDACALVGHGGHPLALEPLGATLELLGAADLGAHRVADEPGRAGDEHHERDVGRIEVAVLVRHDQHRAHQHCGDAQAEHRALLPEADAVEHEDEEEQRRDRRLERDAARDRSEERPEPDEEREHRRGPADHDGHPDRDEGGCRERRRRDVLAPDLELGGGDEGRADRDVRRADATTKAHAATLALARDDFIRPHADRVSTYGWTPTRAGSTRATDRNDPPPDVPRGRPPYLRRVDDEPGRNRERNASEDRPPG